MKELILNVKTRSAEELIKHKAGPGQDTFFQIITIIRKGNIYTIMRRVNNVDRPEQHVEPHSHEFESLFIFKGDNPDFSGLEVEVLLGNEWHRFESPKAVSIPPGLNHTYRFIRGSGEYWNIVIAPGAEYNKTIK